MSVLPCTGASVVSVLPCTGASVVSVLPCTGANTVSVLPRTRGSAVRASLYSAVSVLSCAGDRTAEHVQGVAGLSHISSRLCETDQGGAGGHLNLLASQ